MEGENLRRPDISLRGIPQTLYRQLVRTVSL
jgi:hypothetical protein